MSTNTDTITVPAAPVEQPAPVVAEPKSDLIGAEPSAYVKQQAAAQAAAAAQQSAPAPRTFTAEEVEAIRTQEKDKLYPRLDEVTQKYETLEQKLAAIEEEKANREREAQEAIEAQRKAEEEAELAALSAKEQINVLRSEWESRFNAEKEERERAQAILDKERAMSALQEYKTKRLQEPEIAQAVMPHLHAYITGSNEEEIELAIQRAAETSQKILGDVQAARQQAYQTAPGVSTSAPTIGPTDVQDTTRQLSAQDIQNMSLADYQALRPRLGMK